MRTGVRREADVSKEKEIHDATFRRLFSAGQSSEELGGLRGATVSLLHLDLARKQCLLGVQLGGSTLTDYGALWALTGIYAYV